MVKRSIYPSWVLGHRGACAWAPENTLRSIRRAATDGASMVELDVQLTAEGRCVLMHDMTLDRTTDGSGVLSSSFLADISGLDAGKWFSEAFVGELVPTLEEVIDLALELNLGLNIEMKASPGREVETALTTIGVLRSAWPTSLPRPLLTSLDRTCLEVAASLAADWPKGLIADTLPDDWCSVGESLQLEAFHLDERTLGPEVLGRVSDAGYDVAAWTVNDLPRAQQLRKWGISAIISDDPGLLLKAE